MPKIGTDKTFQAIHCLQNGLAPTPYFNKGAYNILYTQCKTKEQKELLNSVKSGKTHPSCLFGLFGYKEPN